MSRRLALVLAGLAFACAWTQACAQAAPAKPQPQPQPQRTLPARPAAPATPREPAVDATFKAWDADHDGVLSQAEFRQGWNSVRRRAQDKVEASLRTQFDKVDANHDGAIDAAEYGHLLLVQRAGKSAPALASFDRNGDPRLEFDEYMVLVGRMAVAPRKPQGKSP